MKRKILFVIENVTYGGGEKLFEHIIRTLDHRRFEVFAACQPGGFFTRQILGKATILPLSLYPQFDLRHVFRLAKIMREHSIDIVNSQGARADFYSRLAARLTGVPRMYSTVAMPPEGFDVSPLKKAVYVLMNRFSERFVDRIFVPSRSLQRQLVSGHRLPEEKVVFIPNGVDTAGLSSNPEERARIRQELKIPDEAVLAGTVSRLVWQKGLPYLIEAVSRLDAKTASRLHVLITGEGPERKKLEAQAASLGVSGRITFAGFRTDVRAILSALDIFLLPSLREGQPIGLIEAMAAGKPAVATDIEGVNETVIDGITGILVKPGDPEGFARALASLVSGSGAARRMGEAARRTAVEKYNFDTIVKQYETFYEER